MQIDPNSINDELIDIYYMFQDVKEQSCEREFLPQSCRSGNIDTGK